MSRFKQHVAGRGGWSEWIFPTHGKDYLLKCCDCGLVHEVQFRPFAEAKRRRGAFEIIPLPWPIRVMFRARRERKR